MHVLWEVVLELGEIAIPMQDASVNACDGTQVWMVTRFLDCIQAR